MLSGRNLNDKTYEEFIAEAVAQIPFYSREWSNYNPSDPGITILENFSAFAALQESVISEIPEAVKWQLLELAGIKAQPGRAAEVFLCRKDQKKQKPDGIPGKKLFAQDLCFEYAKGAGLEERTITGIAVRSGKGEIHCDALLEEYGVSGGVEIFGEGPRGGEEIRFFLDGYPVQCREILLYVEAVEEFARIPFDGGKQPFAQLEWYLETKDERILLTAEDRTGGFLASGFICLTPDVYCGGKREARSSDRPEPEESAGEKSEEGSSGCPEPEESAGEKSGQGNSPAGCVLCACIRECSYDIVPRIRAVRGLLTRAIQKNTHAEICFYELPVSGGRGDVRIKITHGLLRNGYFEVYMETERGYALWNRTEVLEAEEPGRYTAERTDACSFVLSFSGQLSGRHLMISMCDAQLAAHRSLGILYGYDGQEFELMAGNTVLRGGTAAERVYPKEFLLLAVKRQEGHLYAQIFGPEETGEEAVIYTINEEKGTLTVRDCGAYEGAQLFVGHFCTYAGAEGNVIRGTLLSEKREENAIQDTWENAGCDILFPEKTGGDERAVYVCGVARRGRYAETLKEVRRRFAKECFAPVSLVTAEDYRQIIFQIPGLSIDRIRADVPSAETAGKNEIQITVKPNGRERFPMLSEACRKRITDELRDKKMLSARIVIRQPQYVPIHVHAVICVKKYMLAAEETIRKVLDRELDGIHSDRNFGETVLFHTVFRALSALECVEEIAELALHPGNAGGWLETGLDVHLNPWALCYPGEYHLELGSRGTGSTGEAGKCCRKEGIQ